MALAILSGEPAAQAAYVEKGVRANLRVAAFQGAPVLAVLAPETPVSVLGVAGDYVEVETRSGQRGWISETLLSKKNEVEGDAGDRDAWCVRAEASLAAERARREKQEKQRDWSALVVGALGTLAGFLARGVMCRRRYGWLEAGKSWSRWPRGNGRLMFVRRK
ncbi:MAG: SH3 domain-containing protein [Sulfuricellaceae bacterium]